MTVTSTSSAVLHSPSSICCLTPGERASIYTIMYHGENKLHFDKVLRSHDDLINRSEYFCHKGITNVQFFPHFCLYDEPRDISMFLHVL
jgi:hypothetical protein